MTARHRNTARRDVVSAMIERLRETQPAVGADALIEIENQIRAEFGGRREYVYRPPRRDESQRAATRELIAFGVPVSTAFRKTAKYK